MVLVLVLVAAASITWNASSVPTLPVDVAARCHADGTMRLEAGVDGSSRRNFVLDSGSSISFLDAAIAAQLNLPSAGRIASAGGWAPLVTARLSIGGNDVPPMPIVAAPRATLRGLIHTTDAGIIGSDILRAAQAVTIDVHKCRVSFGPAPQRRGSPRVPLVWHEGRPMVEVPGVGRLLLDSGATLLIVFEGSSAASTFRPASTAGLVRIARTTGEETGRVGWLPLLSLGDLDLVNVPAVRVRNWYRGEAEAPDGLLPLHLFRRVHINSRDGYATFEASR